MEQWEHIEKKLTNHTLTCSIILDFAFSGEADFLDDVGRLLAVEDCLPEERPDPVREVADSGQK